MLILLSISVYKRSDIASGEHCKTDFKTVGSFSNAISDDWDDDDVNDDFSLQLKTELESNAEKS